MFEIESQWLAYGLIVLPIASVHMWLPAFTRRFADHEDVWVGFTGGIALGYVLMYMLPKVSAMTMMVIAENPDAHHFSHLRAYLVLLAGVIAYLAIDRLDQSSNPLKVNTARRAEYAVHGVYNLLATYIAIELPAPGILAHVLIASILVLHVMGMSNLLRHRHGAGYLSVRWVFLTLALSGGVIALVTELPKAVINATTAFVGGIILLNVISEELPTGQKQRFIWFLAGVVTLLLTMLMVLGALDGRSPMLGGLRSEL